MSALLISGFKIGKFNIRFYSLAILLGLIVGYTLILRESKKKGIDKEKIDNLCFWTVIFAIIGARIYYVLFNLDYYLKNISSIFKIWEGGLAIHGGIIAGLITIAIYTKKNNMKFLEILDIISPGLIIGQAIGRWGNFFNMEAHGPATTVKFLKQINIPNFIIDGMNINGVYYHPTFFYESIWCIIGFIIILLLRRYKKIKLGQITGFYLSFYGLGRFLIESLRTDSLMLGSLKVAQFVSILMMICGIYLIVMGFIKKNNLYRQVGEK